MSDINAVHLEVFKEQLNHTVQLFGPTLGTGAGTARAKAKRPHGVLFTNAPGIPSDPQAPQSSVGKPNLLLLLLVPLLLILLLPRKKKEKSTCVSNAQGISSRKLTLMITCLKSTTLERT